MDEDDVQDQGLGGILANGMYTTEEGRMEAKGILDDYRKRYAGQDPDEPTKQIIDKMGKRAEATRAALRNFRKQLMDQQYNPGDALLAASAAFGRPTRTGSFGETLSNVFNDIREPMAKNREFERKRQDQLRELDIADVDADKDVDAAQLQLELLNRRLSGSLANKALDVMGRPIRGQGGTGNALRDRKILDVQSQLLATGQFDVKSAYDRAVNIVDKNWEVFQDPQNGTLKITDKVNNKSYELPLENMPRKNPPPGGNGQPQAKTPPTNVPVAQSPPVTGEPSTDPRDTVGDNDMTMWEAANLGTGLWSSIRSGVSIPSGWVGLPVAKRTERARQVLKNGTQPMIRALAVNDRFPVGEMEQIRQDINTLPQVLDNPGLMHERMSTLDASLRTTLKQALADAEDRSLPEEQRKAREVLASAIRSFLPKLGIPPSTGDSDAPPEWLPDQHKALWKYWSKEEQQRVMQLLGGQQDGK